MNKKVIEKVIKEFESEVDSRYINIISRFDYKVIELLVNAVEKITKSDALSQIFEKYKTISDNDFVAMVLKFVSTLKINEVQQEKQSLKRLFCFSDIYHTNIAIVLIYSFRKAYVDDLPCLVLSEGPLDVKKIPPIYNKVIFYGDEELRDLDFNLLIERNNGKEKTVSG